METNETHHQHRLNNCLNNSPATTRTRILQVLPDTPSSIRLHTVPVLGENPECQTPIPGLQAVPRRKTTSRDHQRDNTALPPFHSEGSGNTAGLHPDDRGSNTRWLLQRADEIGERVGQAKRGAGRRSCGEVGGAGAEVPFICLFVCRCLSFVFLFAT